MNPRRLNFLTLTTTIAKLLLDDENCLANASLPISAFQRRQWYGRTRLDSGGDKQ